ncbi:porin family protein [Pinibacter soli]|uniref:Porin family protein n=1 Tax=Pinibacter soli TaxID=3044211 RepID=A0ABT6RJR7_9BACT|nr:porin family protein [Pinibacter soli]MDI3322097.1 porin family protein [Pinibacter soli]
MKVKLTIVALLSVILANAQTSTQTVATEQPVPQSSFQWGIKGGLNFTSIRGEGMNTKFGTGVEGGLFGSWNFSKNFNLQPELLVSQSNTTRSDDFMVYYVNSGKAGGDKAIKLTTLNVPVLLKYNVTKMFSVLAGPQYNYMLFDNEDLLRDDKDAFTKGEFSGNVGAQFNVSSVSIYGRYNFGLSDINNVDDRYSWHSSHILIGVGVRLK